MCSISGFISSQPLDRITARNLMQALLFYGAVRGQQSAGAYANGKVAKAAMAPDAFVETSSFFNLFPNDTRRALGHTRQPTCGGRTDEQAQPFHKGKVITVHNGFYFDTTELKKTWNIDKPSGVDSELVTTFIEAHGVEKLPRFLETTDGPSAIAAIVGKKMYLMRSGNPISLLHVTLTDDTDVMVFASTSEILMNAVRYVWLLSDGYKPFTLPENVLFEVTPETIKQMSEVISPAVHNLYGDDDCYFSRDGHWVEVRRGGYRSSSRWWERSFEREDKDITTSAGSSTTSRPEATDDPKKE